jgi:hypothetical protein
MSATITCDAVLHGNAQPHAIAVLLPLRDDATMGLGFGLCCSSCASFGTGKELSEALLKKLRESLISDLREIPRPTGGGRA